MTVFPQGESIVDEDRELIRRFNAGQSQALRCIFAKDGFLCITENGHWGIMRKVDTRLDEIQPGVLACHGRTLDFTGEMPAWKNYRLEKR